LLTHRRKFQYRIGIESTGAIVMRVVVKKWGNSAAVRIPSGIMQAVRLSLDEAVYVREEDGRIVIEPIRKDKYDLVHLLAGITPENSHAGVDFGAPVGKELL
jgi:antitoxin MazE